MKKNQKIISIIACITVIIAGVLIYNDKSVQFDVTTMDTATTDGSDIKDDIIEIEEEPTPLATIGNNNAKTRNLNSSELAQIKAKLVKLVNQERKTGAGNKTVPSILY